METKLAGISEISTKKPKIKFSSIGHLINAEMLRKCHNEMKSSKAVGMDGVTKEMYESNFNATKSNPSVSFFVNAVKNNLSSTLSMRLLTTSGETSGHTVSVVGYCKTYYSAATHTYVIVANGWYSDAPVFIDYNNVDFVNTYGVTYDID